MNELGSDLYDAIGKSWLVLVDRYSGYTWNAQLRDKCTSSVTAQLQSWFTEYGWPNTIRTDGGPAYRNEFSNFCSNNGIKHELCSAYNPESNGLAEAGVKNMKALVERCKEREENLEEAIAAWRNMARNELFYGRKLRQTLPMLPITGWTDQDVSSRDTTHTKQAELRDRNTANFKQLKPGQRVLVQHHVSKDWTIRGTNYCNQAGRILLDSTD